MGRTIFSTWCLAILTITLSIVIGCQSTSPVRSVELYPVQQVPAGEQQQHAIETAHKRLQRSYYYVEDGSDAVVPVQSAKLEHELRIGDRTEKPVEEHTPLFVPNLFG